MLTLTCGFIYIDMYKFKKSAGLFFFTISYYLSVEKTPQNYVIIYISVEMIS